MFQNSSTRMDAPATDRNAVRPLMAKQPIFDRQGSVWGYELLCRDTEDNSYTGPNGNTATSAVMLDGLEFMRPILRADQRFLINFTEEFLETGLPSLLPPSVCAIEILESVKPTPEVIRGLSDLKRQGYLLALDDFIGQEDLLPFLPLVDIIKIDVLGMDRGKLWRLTEDVSRRFSAKLLAEKVEDRQCADYCKTLGFALFQGHFYSKAEIITGRRLSPSQTAKTKILLKTTDPGMDLQQIKEIITSDISLTYRLLRYINSVFFGMPVKVVTVDHAVILLGVEKIRQWLIVTSMAELDASPMSQEIALMAAFRAKFLETLAHMHPATRHGNTGKKLFLAGLFSLLEGLLNLPLDDIFEALPIDDDVREVLTKGTGPLAPLYKLMLACDKGLWSDARALSRELALSDNDLTAAYAEAAGWSRNIFAGSGGKSAPAGAAHAPARAGRI